MNLAFADVVMLSRALDAYYKNKSNDRLEIYSTTCLRRVWYAQRFLVVDDAKYASVSRTSRPSTDDANSLISTI